jgi:hypothetical protein
VRLGRPPLISVAQTADFGNCDDLPGGGCGDRSVVRSVFVEPEVRARPMVIAEIRTKDATQMGPEHSVTRPKPRTSDGALQCSQLVPQRDVSRTSS